MLILDFVTIQIKDFCKKIWRSFLTLYRRRIFITSNKLFKSYSMFFKNFLHKSIKEIQDYEFHKENCLNLSFKLKKFIFETFKEIFLKSSLYK